MCGVSFGCCLSLLLVLGVQATVLVLMWIEEAKKENPLPYLYWLLDLPYFFAHDSVSASCDCSEHLTASVWQALPHLLPISTQGPLTHWVLQCLPYLELGENAASLHCNLARSQVLELGCGYLWDWPLGGH